MPASPEVASAANKKSSKSKTSPQKKTELARRAPTKGAAEVTPARETQKGLKRAFSKTTKAVADHPVVSVGTLLGAGVLVGVAARALRHKPTFTETVANAINSRANRVGKSARSGIKKATSSVRRALK